MLMAASGMVTFPEEALFSESLCLVWLKAFALKLIGTVVPLTGLKDSALSFSSACFLFDLSIAASNGSVSFVANFEYLFLWALLSFPSPEGTFGAELIEMVQRAIMPLGIEVNVRAKASTRDLRDGNVNRRTE